MVREVFIDLSPPGAVDTELCSKSSDRGEERVPAPPGCPGTFCDCREEKSAFPGTIDNIMKDRFVVLAGYPQCPVNEQE
jgi:hypothetical protein